MAEANHCITSYSKHLIDPRNKQLVCNVQANTWVWINWRSSKQHAFKNYRVSDNLSINKNLKVVCIPHMTKRMSQITHTQGTERWCQFDLRLHQYCKHQTMSSKILMHANLSHYLLLTFTSMLCPKADSTNNDTIWTGSLPLSLAPCNWSCPLAK